MSRIGKRPIPIPKDVQVAVHGRVVEARGPKGGLSHTVHELISVELADGQLIVRRASDSRQAKALHGLTRSLLANLVHGVRAGFEKRLEIVGIGYRAQLQGRVLTLSLGFSHPVVYPVPDGIQVEVERQTQLTIRGIDKGLVGQVAANLRAFRPPDPYKGKGIKYADEVVRKKLGKTGAK